MICYNYFMKMQNLENLSKKELINLLKLKSAARGVSFEKEITNEDYLPELSAQIKIITGRLEAAEMKLSKKNEFATESCLFKPIELCSQPPFDSQKKQIYLCDQMPSFKQPSLTDNRVKIKRENLFIKFGASAQFFCETS